MGRANAGDEWSDDDHETLSRREESTQRERERRMHSEGCRMDEL